VGCRKSSAILDDAARTHSGLLLRTYLAVTPLLAPVARRHLARRLSRGKEDPDRMSEKLGIASLPRPDGSLIWMHAVGVGEVLALPALVQAIRTERPDIQVLITSTSRTSAEALAPNLPDGARHQFLPLDCLPFVRSFLDHWRPGLSVWAERDIWPALVVETERRGIVLALVNGRMSTASYKSKCRAKGLYRDLYRRFAHIGVQDAETAGHFKALGVTADRLTIDGSLKSGASPLADHPEERARWQAVLAGRRVWLAASTHEGDEDAVLQAHLILRQTDPAACLIIAPRDPHRAASIVQTLNGTGLKAALTGAGAKAGMTVYVVDRIGVMGLWYRLADAAFVGGSLAETGGHNPYEAARLGCALIHGPNIRNFTEDYAAFHAMDAARLVHTSTELAKALLDPALAGQTVPAAHVARQGSVGVARVAHRLLSLGGERLDRTK